MKAQFEYQNKKEEVLIEQTTNLITVTQGKRHTTFQYHRISSGYCFLSKGRIFETSISSITGNQLSIVVNGKTATICFEDPKKFVPKNSSKATQADREVYAFMPGRISKIYVKSGDRISPGVSLLALEAMKMENEIKSQSHGIVAKIHVSVGSSVEGGSILITLNPVEEEGSG